MKKKVFSAFLLAGALVVTPIGGGFISGVVSASSNNTVPARPSASSNNTVTSGSAESASAAYTAMLDDVEGEIADAASGSVIELTGVSALPNGIMKALLKKGDVTLVMSYTYEGVDYVVTIPAGAALDNDISWYGPLYLAAHFGSGVQAEDASYVVQTGDTLSRIAQRNGLTLAQLTQRNPQIVNPNLIRVGQRINLR